ncbi:MAG: ribose-5-phosphate isomerase [Candidatus Pacebacteria bacterium CG10_big_fil_rev_8_21_14_0_10_56_10]|nr:MAG: ribose-5-phosphate isomerase [Candidatus Pacebacteria bacterium CG10_big_fil_rev_8_21_14_0_10_56_10]
MTIYLGTDHGGFRLKEEVRRQLEDHGYQLRDCGAFELDPADDYPDFALPLAKLVAGDTDGRGLLLCRSGGGMVIAANKVVGIRAVLVSSPDEARHARQHNNANIISIAADWVDRSELAEIINVFVETPFSQAERHARRLAKIAQYEQSHHE